MPSGSGLDQILRNGGWGYGRSNILTTRQKKGFARPLRAAKNEGARSEDSAQNLLLPNLRDPSGHCVGPLPLARAVVVETVILGQRR